MTHEEFWQFASDLRADAEDVLVAKGKDYARDNNAFHNFEVTADFTGCTREQAVGQGLYKQFAALFRYIRDGELESEGFRSRAIDVINYVTFLAAMVEEDKKVDLSAGRDIEDDSFRSEYSRWRKIILDYDERTNP